MQCNIKKRIIPILILVGFITGCNFGENNLVVPSSSTVLSTIPADLSTGVAINTDIQAAFSEAMNGATITSATFTLMHGTTPALSVICEVTYAGTVATLNPTGDLAPDTTYTATITTGVKDLSDRPLAQAKVWSFTTIPLAGPARLPVNLGTAGNFAILAKSGIDTVPTSAITGDIGVSPIDSTALTGFSETMDASNEFSTSPQVTGRMYAANYAPPTPANMTTAVSDMETAYTDAAGRILPDCTELGAGNISGLTLAPGLYKWGTGVLITSDVTLEGSASDVWIFQIAHGITVTSGVQIHLTGGALAKNVFWQTFGAVTFDTTAHFEGVVLSMTEITLATGASVNGRLLSQTAVTLQSNTVTQPVP